MIVFKFDPKTGRFDYSHTGFISKNCFKILEAIAKNQYGTPEIFQAIFENISDGVDERNDHYQIISNSTLNLIHLNLIEWKNDHTITTWVDHKNYKNNKTEKRSGYFLTGTGKAFLRSLGIEIFSPYKIK